MPADTSFHLNCELSYSCCSHLSWSALPCKSVFNMNTNPGHGDFEAAIICKIYVFHHALNNVRWTEGCVPEDGQAPSETTAAGRRVLIQQQSWICVKLWGLQWRGPLGKKAAMVWNPCVLLSLLKKLCWSNQCSFLTFAQTCWSRASSEVLSVNSTFLGYWLPYSSNRFANAGSSASQFPKTPFSYIFEVQIWSTDRDPVIKAKKVNK